MNNSEVMDRYGFSICTNCNGDMPSVVDGECKWCINGEQRVSSVEPPGSICVLPQP